MDDDAILDAIFNNGPTLITTEDKLTEDYPNLMQLKQFEFDALALAQEGKLEESVQVFSKAIEACPLYASAYNNRAQAFRLLNQNDKALLDLDKAIEYGAKQPNILKQVKLLTQAYSQRGALYLKLGLAEQAEQDFLNGARNGGLIAKGLVKNNPYARLCNQMVAEAMKQLVNKEIEHYA